MPGKFGNTKRKYNVNICIFTSLYEVIKQNIIPNSQVVLKEILNLENVTTLLPRF